MPSLISPSLVLGFILATLFGAGFHLVVGGEARRLALFLLVGWIGFAAGHFVGIIAPVNLFAVGALRAGSGGIGAFIALVVTYLLSINRGRSRARKRNFS